MKKKPSPFARLVYLTALWGITNAVQAQDAPLFQWAGNFKNNGSVNPASVGYGVATDASGNVYSTGAFTGTADFDPGAGVFNLTSVNFSNQDIYISKLYADGTFAWAVSFGALGKDDIGFSVAADALGNVYATGIRYSGLDFDPGPGVFTLPGSSTTPNNFVLKLDTDGNFVWAKTIGPTGGTAIGRGVALDHAGNVLVTGNFTGTLDFDPGAGSSPLTAIASGNGFVQKLDNNGNFIWAKALGTSALSLTADNLDNVIATGQFSATSDFDPGAGTFNMTPLGGVDIFITKLDASGSFVWAKSMGGTSNEAGKSLTADNAGNVFTSGYFQNTVDFDPGTGVYNLTAATQDGFIVKLDATGNFAWAMSVGGSQVNGIATDASGNVLTTGYFNGTVDFDPGPGLFNMTSAASNDIFILKLDNSGNFRWAVRNGQTNQPDEGNGITVGALGDICTTGMFSTSVDFDFGPCTVNLTAAFNTDINAYVEKIILGPTYLPTLISVSPTSGPTGTSITITGTDFSPVLADNVVRFSSTLVPVSAVTPTTISATVPSIGNGPYNVRLTIGCVAITSGPIFTVTAGSSPTITSFTPASGVVGTTVTITGTNFSATPANNAVKFNGTAATVTASTTTSITTTVPAGATTGKITVTVAGNTGTSGPNFTVPTPPTIAGFAPANGPVGTTVTLTGTNFSSTPVNNIVFFGATQAAVSAATTTQLTVTVPAGATYEPISLSVGGLTAHAPRPFVVTFSGGGNIDDCSFAPSTTIATVPTFVGPAFADVDGDGKPDLLIPNYTSSNFLSIFRNTSTLGTITPGSFAPKIDFGTGTEPVSVAVGDLDGDGKRDIAVVNYRGGKLSVYKNQSTPGTLSLAARVDFTIPDFADDVSIADMDGDGKQDLTITTSLVGLTVLRNTGTPGIINASTFAAGITFATGPNAFPFVLGDMDGDGKLDAAVPNANAYFVSLLRNTSTPGLISFATQTLTITTGTPAVGGGTLYTVLGDIDGDNKLDLVVTTNTVNTVSVFRNTSVTGSLSFDPKFDIVFPTTRNTPALNDLDGDGKIELIVDRTTTEISVYKNVSTAGVINATSFATPVVIPRSASTVLLTGDVDGDGRSEIISSSGPLQIFRNTIGTIPPPAIASFAPLSGPVGTTVTLTGTNFDPIPANNIVKFNGTTGTVTASNATSITTTVPAGATTGKISITVGCLNALSTTDFTVTASPVITITTQPVSSNACEGTIATFTAAATGTTNLTYQWQFSPTGPPAFADIVDGTNYSGAATSSLLVNTAGSFGTGRYRCRINGDLAVEVITIDEGLMVNPVPPAPGTSGNSGCNAASVTLTATGGVNGQYRWYTVSTAGTALPGEVNSTYLTPTLSVTTIYYASIDDGTCESTRTPATATINMVTKPTVITSNCTTSSATLSGPPGFTTYAWSNGATTQAITVSTAGSYTLVVTAANGCVSPPSDATTLASTFCNQPPLIGNTAISTVTEGTITLSISSLLSDPDDNLDLSTLKVVTQPTSGAVASIGPNATLTLDYKGKAFAGKDELTLGVCDLSGVCVENILSVDVAGEIIVNNAISPNGDTKNDAWIIQYIDALPETKANHVSVFNRWGDAVFETDNYDNVNRVFRGFNNGGNELPTGTYFYKLEFSSGRKTQTGYLSLKR